MAPSTIPGRIVPAPVLAKPEQASEHIRNALMLLDPCVARDGSARLDAAEVRGIRQRLVAAIIELERLA